MHQVQIAVQRCVAKLDKHAWSESMLNGEILTMDWQEAEYPGIPSLTQNWNSCCSRWFRYPSIPKHSGIKFAHPPPGPERNMAGPPKANSSARESGAASLQGGKICSVLKQSGHLSLSIAPKMTRHWINGPSALEKGAQAAPS